MRIGAVLALVFLISFVSAWDNGDCTCDLGLEETVMKGQGSSANCNWKGDGGTVKLSAWSYPDYSLALSKFISYAESTKEDLEGNKNYEEVEGENSYLFYFENSFGSFDGRGRVILGEGHEFTFSVKEFGSMSQVREIMGKLERCSEEMSESRTREKGLMGSVSDDEKTPGSKGLDYLEENRGTSWFWNLRYWLGFVSDDAFPWVEEAAQRAGASGCDNDECYLEKAVKTGEYLLCEMVYLKEDCYGDVADSLGDPGVCDKAREYVKWGRGKMVRACYRQFSGKQNDVSECDKIEYDDERGVCYEAVAYNSGSSEHCFSLKNNEVCLLCYVARTNDTSVCDYVGGSNLEYCNSRRAAEGCGAPMRRLVESECDGEGGCGAARG